MKINTESIRRAVRAARDSAPRAAQILQQVGSAAMSAGDMVGKVSGTISAAESIMDAARKGRIRVEFGANGVHIHTGVHEEAGGTGDRVVF